MSVLRSGVVNAAALASGTLTAILLPPVLVRSLEPADYSVWMLSLQTVTLVSLFELGVGMTATRLIGQRLVQGSLSPSAWTIARAAVQLHLLVSAVAAGAVLLSASALPALFPEIPDGAVQGARVTWLTLGLIAAAQIPVQSVLAPLAAVQRAYPMVATVAAASLAASLLVILAAWQSGSLRLMVAVWAAAQLLGVTAAIMLARRRQPRPKAGRHPSAMCLVYRETRWQSLILLFAFLVSGVDVAIVGRYAFGEVAAFAIAASIVIRLVAVVHALQAPLLAEYARDVGAGAVDRIHAVVARQTRLASLAVVLVFGTISVLAPAVFPVWIGDAVGVSAATYVGWLALGAGIRLLGIPVATLATAAGKQKVTVIAGVAESAVNLTLSLMLIRLVGPVGVALGTIAGGVVSLMCHYLITLPRVAQLAGQRRGLVREALRSGVPAAALLTGTILATSCQVALARLAVGICATVIALCAGYLLTCTAADRVLLTGIAKRAVPSRRPK